MTALAAFRSRIRLLLGDPDADRFTSNLIDESLRQALDQYTKSWPQIKSASHTVTAAGRDQDLTLTITEPLLTILQVIYPYDAAILTPSYTTAYYFTFGAAPILHLSGDAVPQVGQKISLTYAAPQYIKDLDTATTTTVHATHEGILCLGAAGYANIMRSSEISEAYGSRASDLSQLVEIGKAFLATFTDALSRLHYEHQAHRTVTPLGGWSLDAWDGQQYGRN